MRYNFSRTLSSFSCPECGAKKIIEDHKFGELVCIQCGCVVGKLIDRGPEWRSFDSQEKERVGPPQRPTLQISTVIGSFTRATPEQRTQIQRLQKLHKRMTIDERIRRGILEIERVSSPLGLPPSIREMVASLWIKFIKNKPHPGRKIPTLIGALTYYTLRKIRRPRPLKEIASVIGIESKELAAAYRALIKEGVLHSPPVEPIDFVPKIISELNLSGEVRNKAIEILEKAHRIGLDVGKNPLVMAATAVYIAARMHKVTRVSQKEVANAAGVTDVSIRSHYKELIKMMGFTLNVHKGRKKFQPAFFIPPQ
jgi:transcription initiation factor TFIIB